MTPTLHHFTCALLTPGSFSTIRPASVRCDEQGMPLIRRTSRFAEAEIEWQGAWWLLSMPLSEEADRRAEHLAKNLRTCLSPYLTEFRLLPRELAGQVEYNSLYYCNLFLQRLPSGGGFCEVIEQLSANELLTALDALETELRQIGFAHRNLTPENLRWSNGRFYPVRYYDALFGSADRADLSRGLTADAEAFARLRQHIQSTAQHPRHQICGSFDTAQIPPRTPLFEGLSRYEEQGLFGYANATGKSVIPPKFRWAGHFQEGRAEVETDTGMGVIDPSGAYILPPRYEMVDYDSRHSVLSARQNGLWARFDYFGQQISDFTEKRKYQKTK